MPQRKSRRLAGKPPLYSPLPLPGRPGKRSASMGNLIYATEPRRKWRRGVLVVCEQVQVTEVSDDTGGSLQGVESSPEGHHGGHDDKQDGGHIEEGECDLRQPPRRRPR